MAVAGEWNYWAVAFPFIILKECSHPEKKEWIKEHKGIEWNNPLPHSSLGQFLSLITREPGHSRQRGERQYSSSHGRKCFTSCHLQRFQPYATQIPKKVGRLCKMLRMLIKTECNNLQKIFQPIQYKDKIFHVQSD